MSSISVITKPVRNVRATVELAHNAVVAKNATVQMGTFNDWKSWDIWRWKWEPTRTQSAEARVILATIATLAQQPVK